MEESVDNIALNIVWLPEPANQSGSYTHMLGKIESVPIRAVWKNEAHDFTPWRASNIEELGSALGLELEHEDRELPVGPYCADILASRSSTVLSCSSLIRG